MATKLKDIKMTSVDLCGQGANPDAHIMLYKSKDMLDGQSTVDVTADTQNESFLKSIISGFAKMLGMKEPEAVAAEITRSAVEKWATGETAQEISKAGDKGEYNKNNYDRKETNTMNIDKSKMSADELAQLAEFEKKYGLGDELPTDNSSEAQNTDSGTDDVTKTDDTGLSSVNPDVAKALSDFKMFEKTAMAQVEELKKTLEMERMDTIAKKYEILGKKPDELSKKLYEIKKFGSSAYDDYISMLDEQVTFMETSGLFKELGSNKESGISGTWSKIEKAAEEIVKRDGITKEQALEKVGIENPVLISEYRKENQ